MSYATGSASDLNGLLDAIRLFAIDRGWTVDKWTSGSNLLFLSKGICFVQMQGASATWNMYDSGSLVSTVETTLRLALSTGVTTALTTYHGHPGSLVTTATDSDRVEVNDLTGPFNSYHLFADSTVGDHIHVVVQTASDRWQHFSFGLVHKGDLTHGGVSYLVGANRQYWRGGSGGTPYDASNSGNYYNDILGFSAPFILNPNDNAPLATARVQLNAPDALPNNPTNWPTMVATAGGTTVLRLAKLRAQPSDFPQLAQPFLLSSLVQSPASQWGGNVVMWAMPVIRMNTSLNQACYVGDFPNVRLLNMEGMIPQQEIALGSETWKVFPAGRQTSWGSKTALGNQFSTGNYALAFKKVA